MTAQAAVIDPCWRNVDCNRVELLVFAPVNKGVLLDAGMKRKLLARSRGRSRDSEIHGTHPHPMEYNLAKQRGFTTHPAMK
jgi:hypothetical protein